MSKIPKLETFKGLQGVSTLILIISSSYVGDRENRLNIPQAFNQAGHMAIYFIFVLSSFLFSYKWYNKMIPPQKELLSNGKNSPIIKNSSNSQIFKPSKRDLLFSILKVIFKIYPLYVIVLIFYGGVAIPTFDELFWRRLFMLPAQSYSHLWPVRVGFCYALLVPVFQLLSAHFLDIERKSTEAGKSSHAHKIMLGTITLTAIWVNCVGYVYSFGEDLAPLWQHFPVFWYGTLSGIICFYLERNKYTLYKPQKRGFWKYGEIIIYTILGYITLTNQATSAAFLRKYTILCTSSAVWATPLYGLLLIFIALTEGETSLGKFLRSNLFIWAGELTYSIYLIVFVPIICILNINIRGFEAVLSIIFLSCWVGWGFHRYIEENGIKLGDTLIRTLGGEVNSDKRVTYSQIEESNSKLDFLANVNSPPTYDGKGTQVEMKIEKEV